MFPRRANIYLFQENLRYDTIAESLGARGGVRPNAR